MSKESSLASLDKKKKQTRNSDTAKGLYSKVRSKWLKEKGTNYGQVVTAARENAMDANGGPLPKGTAVHHVNGSVPGAKNTKDDANFEVVSFGDNVRESNMRRGKKADIGKIRAWIKKRAK
jgi:hypothetical protein